MNNNINIPPDRSKSKVMLGAILLLVGTFLLLRQFGLLFIPDSIDLWPLWLIFWGLVIGARNNFQKSSGVILIGLGVIFMITENIHNADGFIWPAAIIALGLWIMSKKSNKHNVTFDQNYWDKKYRTDTVTTETPVTDFSGSTFTGTSTEVPPVEPAGSMPPPSHDDYLDATSIFGGVNKTILSKSFKGGDITNIFGGTELDFTQADINGRVVIDVTQIFGGTKLIVPANWHVIPDMASIFAGVDDKRMKTGQPQNMDKVLVLKGVSLFAGIDIRSY